MINLLQSRKPKKKKKAFKRTPAPAVNEAAPRTKLQWVVLLVAFVVLVGAMLRFPTRDKLEFEEDIDTSVVSMEDIRAAFYFESVDLQKTNEARNKAVAEVPDYYRADRGRVEEAVARVNERIALLREQRAHVVDAVTEALKQSTSADAVADIVDKAVAANVANLKQEPNWEQMPDPAVLSLWLRPDPTSLPERVFATSEAPAEEGSEETAPVAPQPVTELQGDPETITFSYGDRLAELARTSLSYVLTAGVRPAALPPDGGSKPVVILRDMPVADLELSSAKQPLSEVPDPVLAADKLSERLRETARRAAKSLEEPDIWAKLHEAALAVAQAGLTDTIRYDRVATAGAVERAREAVQPVMHEIEAGEIIQEGGRRWTAQSREDVKTYRGLLQDGEEPSTRIFATLAAHAILVVLVLICLYRCIPIFGPSQDRDPVKLMNLALLLLCGTLVLGRVASYFEPTGYLLPVAAAGILYAILVNGRLAAVFSILAAVLVSAQYGHDWRLLLVLSSMSLAGVFSIYKVRRRGDMAAASLKATLFGLAALASITFATDSLVTTGAFQRLMLLLLNGGICLMAVPTLLAPLERLFGITTDITLLEYSDLNNEVLNSLALAVPATFSHSLMLGQLGEAAADAIGANGLLARVCAYYHDIGKMRRPEYFSENQTGANIHDELSPRLSARAIAAHVTQGAEMAREYHLPQPIIDGILEHHGTCLIGYFYQQAMEQQKHGDVREEDFRYPGPRPQSPETAILMICDASESGVRSIKNPNEDRVREFVDKIIAARAADRQFDDCNLTLRQLDTIAEVVTTRILSTLHTRVAYPDVKKREEPEPNIIPMQGGGSA
jgi:hypothetical protein